MAVPKTSAEQSGGGAEPEVELCIHAASGSTVSVSAVGRPEVPITSRGQWCWEGARVGVTPDSMMTARAYNE